MAESSEVNEVPISDPPTRHPRSWSESSAASLADRLISPTSAGLGNSLETSGELSEGLYGGRYQFEFGGVAKVCSTNYRPSLARHIIILHGCRYT